MRVLHMRVVVLCPNPSSCRYRQISKAAKREGVGSTGSTSSTHLIPLPDTIILLEKPLVMRDTVLAVDEAVCRGGQRVHVDMLVRRIGDDCGGIGRNGARDVPCHCWSVLRDSLLMRREVVVGERGGVGWF